MSAWLPRTVELIDGRHVLSDSPEWAADCLARELAHRDLQCRREVLGVLGDCGFAQLVRNSLTALWQRRQA